MASKKEFKGLPSTSSVYCTNRIGLILPTSLCSSQIAVLIANKLNEDLNANSDDQNSPNHVKYPVTKFVALPHTEGCGVSSGSCEVNNYIIYFYVKGVVSSYNAWVFGSSYSVESSIIRTWM